MEKPFDVHGWDYTPESLATLVKAHAGIGVQLIDDLLRGGGKAFGLRLCGKLVAESRQFSVPGWIPVGPNCDRDRVLGCLDSMRYLIARSSGYHEDWLDPRSGVDVSRNFNSTFAKKELDGWMSAKEPKVLQENMWGCGCVIDVGYSELLERPIARVAEGHRNFIGGDYTQFTSATWDHESQVAIYDAETAEYLFGSELGFRDMEQDPFPGLIKELVSSLKRAGIEFGVQFEIIVDPRLPIPTTYLVQVRPSPGSVRGPKEKPEVSGKLASTTGKVNKAGDVSGPVVHIGEDWRNRSDVDEQLDHAMGVIRYGRGEIEPVLAGKIVHWDFGDLLKYKYDPALPILAASLMGAIGQTCVGYLFGNSAHGTYIEYSGDRKKWYEQSWQSGLQLGQVDDDFERIVERNKGPEINVRLVSDGLVGQVYVLD